MFRTLLVTVALSAAFMSGCRATTVHRPACCPPAVPTVVAAPVAAAPCCPTPGVVPTVPLH